MALHRRNLMQTAGAFSLAAVAGCTGVLDDDGREPPAYSQDTPQAGADDEDGVFFVHIDAAWLREFDSEEELPYEDELPDAVDIDTDPETAPVDVDPLIAYPTAGLIIGALGLGFGLVPYGFAEEVVGSIGADSAPEMTDTEAETESGEPADDGSVRIDSMLLVDGVGVVRGEFDAEALVAASEEFEPAGERNGFDVYEGTGGELISTEGLAFAVQDGVLVALLDEESSLDPVIDSAADEAAPLTEDGDAAWALETAGHGHVTLGTWKLDLEDASTDDAVDVESVLDDADGGVSSFTLGPEEGTGSLAAVFPEGETPERTAVENEIGTSATSREVTIEGTRVSVTGTWRVAEEEN